jgi:hypothetical protein
MCPVALMRRGIAPPTSAMNSRRFIANPSPDAFNHNEFFITGPSRQTSEMGSKPEKLDASKCFPLCPRERTSRNAVGMSVSCQHQTL